MFCYQCQETVNNKNCSIRGVCGKSEEVAALQNTLVSVLKGIAVYGSKARALGIVDEATDLFVAQALFTTVTNVNFDAQFFVTFIQEALTRRNSLREKFLASYQEKYGQPFAEQVPEVATWQPSEENFAEFVAKGAQIALGKQHPSEDEDLNSLRELLVYGLKGLAAYTEHAYMLDRPNPKLVAFLQEGLVETARKGATVSDLLAMVLKCGAHGVEAMAWLDQAHTERYGHPEPTMVNIGVREGPGILITGHDLRDLEDLLVQTEGTGINVYTNGEMLPANAYPAFKKYPHLVGNYGGAWWEQQKQFESFNGPILVTTNCIQKPTRHYEDRIFTTGMVGWEGIPHIAERKPGQRKDFSPLLAKARECKAPTSLETGTIPIGFAHEAVLNVADKVVEAVKGGQIKRFVVMAGCDGHQNERKYYTEVAAGLPKDTVILTAGCAKFRYNKLGLGNINGFPRILDAGQCNDSYSLVVIAQKLAEAFGLESINDLPLSYDIAWYEQKAVIVLLALLSLNVKKIRLGPTLPAFLSPNVVKVLVEQFDLKPIGPVEEDLKAIMVGA